MKPISRKLFPVIFAAFLFACNNGSSDSAGSADTTAAATPAADEKTEISVGPDGASLKTPGGTDVKVSSEGASVGTKDVNIKATTKDSLDK